MDLKFDVYRDIKARTNGEIYLGVVGPVRSGKSTFVKKFMELCVLPFMQDEYGKKQAVDELPQSGTGKTITTTEPKFIPAEAADITFQEDNKAKVRLIDCVGYMVDGAIGHMENEAERMVHTPWFTEEIPFVKAAEIGTRKVIEEHSTIGIVVTTDGSFTDIPQKDYEPALEKTITQLKQIQKPFVVLVNTQKPYSEEAILLAQRLEQEYGVKAIPMNIAQMKREDIDVIMQSILEEFPLTAIRIETPGWLSMLGDAHPVKQELIRQIKDALCDFKHMRDMKDKTWKLDNENVIKWNVEQIDMANGTVTMNLKLKDDCYYQLLTQMLGEPIECENDLFAYLKQQAGMRMEYEKVQNAMEAVRQKGYGVITPKREEIVLSKPEVIHHGNKYGVKIQALSPSIHLIKANIETEIAPIVGTREQAEDLIAYIDRNALQSATKEMEELKEKEAEPNVAASKTSDGIWNTSIFGKTVEQMVQDGISAKVALIGEESQMKLQDTMQKIVNDTNGGLVCIIL